LNIKKNSQLFSNLGKLIISAFKSKIKILETGEYSICNFSINFLRCREIAHGRGKIFPKVKPKMSSKFCEKYD